LADGLTGLLDPGDVPVALASCWALAWIGQLCLVSEPPEPKMIMALYRLWGQLESEAHAHYPAWALSTQPLLPRDTFDKDVWGDCDLFLHQANERGARWRRLRQAALIVGWYRRAPWSDAELIEHLAALVKDGFLQVKREPTLRNLREALGVSSSISPGAGNDN
jgi:hypothetical protein